MPALSFRIIWGLESMPEELVPYADALKQGAESVLKAFLSVSPNKLHPGAIAFTRQLIEDPVGTEVIVRAQLQTLLLSKEKAGILSSSDNMLVDALELWEQELKAIILPH